MADPHVLVTRPEPGAAATAARLRALGFTPVIAPLLAIMPVAARLPDASGVQAVLIASARALAGLPAEFHAVPLFAVGDASAEAARRAGFTRVASAAGDARALVALARAQLDPAGRTLLLAAGAGQSLELAAALRGAGFRVLRRVTYRAAPVAALPEAAATALAAGRLTAALFFSAETARCFARILPPALHPALAGMRALAIGAPAAAALRHLPWYEVRVALRPTQDELLALL